jgi:CHAD domain-containing protein
MHSSCDLLDQSVERACRIVALDLLDDASKARKRIGDPDDADALHDFRVAVRRLRTWLRALRPWLGDNTPKKSRRRLKKTARLTGESRDAEVHLQWLEAQRDKLRGRERRDVARLVEQIEDDKRESDRRVANAGVRAFDRARAPLARKLSEYRVRIDDGGTDVPQSFAVEMARLIRTHGTELAECLERVRSFADAKDGHRARIAGKRLRYLAEVVAPCVEEGETLVTELGEMQDVLGDWHDVQVFSATVTKARGGAGPGLRLLARRLQSRGRKAFAQVTKRWDDAAAFEPRVEAIAEQLLARTAGALARRKLRSVSLGTSLSVLSRRAERVRYEGARSL